MKFEPTKLSKVIERNFSYLMHDFYEMQTEYMQSMNNLCGDLDASFVAMFLTNKFYQSEIKENYLSDKVTTKNFYQKNKFYTPLTKFKVSEVSKAIGIPRETVRRKKIKLIKNKFIKFNEKKESFSINASLINKKVFESQIKISSKMLSNYCTFFFDNNVLSKDLDIVSFKNDVEKKFIMYLPIFLNFQISYLTQWRKFIDMECLYIVVLCALNTTTQIRRKSNNHNEIFDSREIFTQIFKRTDIFGLNSTSIADITKIPRTTVLRKLAILEKLNLLKKDKNKRYETQDLVNSDYLKKTFYPNLQNTIRLLGFLLSKCLEVYFSKEFKIT
jgi:transcription initiation factor IIE alpha subunit